MTCAPQRKAATSYFELLRHPNWQRKRLEILSRDGFTCVYCGSPDDTLHVHHSYYEKGLKPWDYPEQSLHVLCEACHVTVQEELKQLHRQIGQLYLVEQSMLLGMALGIQMQRDPSVRVHVQSGDIATGIAMLMGVNSEIVVMAIADDHTVSAHDISAKLSAVAL